MNIVPLRKNNKKIVILSMKETHTNIFNRPPERTHLSQKEPQQIQKPTRESNPIPQTTQETQHKYFVI